MEKYIILSVEILTFIVALFYYKKITTGKMMYFIYFLAYTLISEIFAHYLSHVGQSSFYVYNIYILISVFYTIIQNKLVDQVG